jgi:hypothetical protein
MEMTNLNVKDLSPEEMTTINGGGKIGYALRAAWNAVCDAGNWVLYEYEVLFHDLKPMSFIIYMDDIK